MTKTFNDDGSSKNDEEIIEKKSKKKKKTKLENKNSDEEDELNIEKKKKKKKTGDELADNQEINTQENSSRKKKKNKKNEIDCDTKNITDQSAEHNEANVKTKKKKRKLETHDDLSDYDRNLNENEKTVSLKKKKKHVENEDEDSSLEDEKEKISKKKKKKKTKHDENEDVLMEEEDSVKEESKEQITKKKKKKVADHISLFWLTQKKDCMKTCFECSDYDNASNFNNIFNFMKETDEALILEEGPCLSENDRRALKPLKRIRRSSTTTEQKREKGPTENVSKKNTKKDKRNCAQAKSRFRKPSAKFTAKKPAGKHNSPPLKKKTSTTFKTRKHTESVVTDSPIDFVIEGNETYSSFTNPTSTSCFLNSALQFLFTIPYNILFSENHLHVENPTLRRLISQKYMDYLQNPTVLSAFNIFTEIQQYGFELVHSSMWLFIQSNPSAYREAVSNMWSYFPLH